MHSRYKQTKLTEGIFWKAIKSYRVLDIYKAMRRVYVVNPGVVAYLNNIDYKRWAYAHFTKVHYNIITINIIESLNVLAYHARKLPMTMIIEFIPTTLQR